MTNHFRTQINAGERAGVAAHLHKKKYGNKKPQVTAAERRLIDEHLATKGVTPCEPGAAQNAIMLSAHRSFVAANFTVPDGRKSRKTPG